MTKQISAARSRAERYAALAPAGAVVTVTEETMPVSGVVIAQATIKGSIDTICVTISCRPGRRRTRAMASTWFNSHNGGYRKLRVGDIAYRIRTLYI